MGLTVHWQFECNDKPELVSGKLELMRDKAIALGFKEVGKVRQFIGDECEYERYRKKDETAVWSLIQAQGSVLVDERGKVVSESHVGCCGIYVTPLHAIILDTWPGEGCEAANFGLVRYPETVPFQPRSHRFVIVPTGLSVGWHWRSFCKTQYAMEGGIENFLRCHTMVIAMLDFAKELGILKEVYDEGHFWEKRDLQDLVREIGEWDAYIAAFAGQLQQAAEAVGLSGESAIMNRPDFEHLEAKGLETLGKVAPALQKAVDTMKTKQMELGL